MAESVDALVSNTNGCKAVPVRPRLWVQSLNTMVLRLCCFKENLWPRYIFYILST